MLSLLKKKLIIAAIAGLLATPLYSNAASPEPEVKAAQVALNGLGFDAGPADGLNGAVTSAAVIGFQKKHDLPATGRLDSNTQNKLFSLWRAKSHKASGEQTAKKSVAQRPKDENSHSSPEAPINAKASTTNTEPQETALDLPFAENTPKALSELIKNHAPASTRTRVGFSSVSGLTWRSDGDSLMDYAFPGEDKNEASGSLDLGVGFGVANRSEGFGARFLLKYQTFSNRSHDRDCSFIFFCSRDDKPFTQLNTTILSMMGDYLIGNNIAVAGGIEYYLNNNLKAFDGNDWVNLELDGAIGGRIEVNYNYGSGSAGLHYTTVSLEADNGSRDGSLQHRTVGVHFNFHPQFRF